MTSPLQRILDRKKKEKFVGRSTEIQEFIQKVSHHHFDDHLIFSYYGIGGIGKTELSKELKRKLKSMHQFYYTSINFENEKHRTMEKALIYIRKELGKNYKISFPLFDIAYITYIKKTDPEAIINGKTIPFLEESSVIMEIVSATSGIPITSIPKIIDIAYRKADKWLNKSREKMMHEISKMDNTEIFDLLPYIFAEDIRACIEKHHCHFIFFFDAYEALWTGKRDYYNVDGWVRTFVDAMPSSAWVITGREPLDWGKYKEEWSNRIIPPISLENLNDLETYELCSSLGVEDHDIQKVIYQNSEGHPFSISLAIDLFDKIKEARTPVVSDFIGQKTPEKLVKRLMKYITVSERQLLEYLALTNTWTLSTFNAIVMNFRISMNEEDYDELTKFSFIEKIDENHWEMHQLMRSSLNHALSVEKLSRGHKFLHQYFRDKLNKDLIYSDTHNASSLFQEAFYHGYQLINLKEYDKKTFIDWYRSVDENFLNNGKNYLTVSMLEKLIEDLRMSDEEIKLEYLPILIYDLAYIQMWELLNYFEAERLFEEALNLRLSHYGENNLYTAKSYYGLATLYHRQGKKQRAEELYLKSLKIREELLSKENNLAVALSANGLAKLYQDNGNYEKAEQLYKYSLDIRLNQAKLDYVKIVLGKNNLINCYQEMGEYDEAKKLIEDVLNIIQEHLPSQKLEWFKAQSYLAILITKNQCYDEAIKILNEVKDYYEIWYGDNHIRIGDVYHNLALVYALKNKKIVAMEFMEKAIEIKSRVNGLNKAFDKRIGYIKSSKMLELIKHQNIEYEQCKFDFYR